MALIAVRRHIQDPDLEKYIQRRSSLPTNPAILNEGNPRYVAFRNEYAWVLNEMDDRLGELEDRLERLQREANQEWSYEMALGREGSWLGKRNGAPIHAVELQGSDPHQPILSGGDTVHSYELPTNRG
jgi:hypothetical protein